MPRFTPSILISDCWGSVGDLTFYHMGGRCYYKKKSRCEFPGTDAQNSQLDVHRRALAACRTLEHSVQLTWNDLAKPVISHKPPFDNTAHISGQNLFVSAYHGWATNTSLPRKPGRISRSILSSSRTLPLMAPTSAFASTLISPRRSLQAATRYLPRFSLQSPDMAGNLVLCGTFSLPLHVLQAMAAFSSQWTISVSAGTWIWTSIRSTAAMSFLTCKPGIAIFTANSLSW